MKLYYKAGACSLSPHIVLREAGLPVELARVDLTAKTLDDGSDYRAVNPKGQVPALALDEGGILTEGPVIVQYVADRVPESGLLPPPGSIERYRVLEWLNFVGTELHKTASPLIRPGTPDAVKETVRQTLAVKLAILNQGLDGKPYLTGERFTVADAYAFVVLRWMPHLGVDMASFANLAAFSERVSARPAVQAALAAEQQG
ncbi:glutathione transferase GstA [Azospirillum picis]|uniref:Glutathione S-transferase n=1 Tax=Azospirillum picis TaxID=488438 RepID=A0ABU0MPE2_9PROT|nr:glutathione transferase GstA [Azospirillum picis]MBP2301511.1 glutathione S-transferase [Azospirillum picis]MDQ0535343.1 glutathione S-transferase [Azospirillum picis]